MVDQPVVRRPRITGAREHEILGAAMALLGEIGYDRLTLDAVAAKVNVSKASIYRLWGDKSALINAAIGCQRTDEMSLPDTGSLVDDLFALLEMPEFFGTERAAIISGLATAIHRDPERHDAIRRRLVDDGTKHVRALLQRAVRRGELTDNVDIELLCSVIPAMVLFRMTYQTVGTFSPHFVEDVIAKIIAPLLQQQPVIENKGNRGTSSRR